MEQSKVVMTGTLDTDVNQKQIQAIEKIPGVTVVRRGNKIDWEVENMFFFKINMLMLWIRSLWA